jgi:hypothetical protein
MYFLELIKTSGGKIMFSIILGLGLACIFYKTATYKNNIHFTGPIVSEMNGSIFKHGEKCYIHNSNTAKCNTELKHTINIEGQPHQGILSTLFL